MADEFQAEVCGGTWWNSSRSLFGSSPCSSGILDLGSFGWPADFLDIKTRCSSADSASDGSIVIQDLQKRSKQQQDSMDSTLQIMGVGLSASSTTTATTDWDRGLIHGNGSPDQSHNYPPILHPADQNSSMNYRQESGVQNCPEEIQKDWRTTLKNSFSTIPDDHQDSSSLKSLGNQPLNSSQCTAGFPINSVSYGYSSNLLPTFFDAEPQPPPQQQPPMYANRPTSYPPSTNYQTSLNELPVSLPKFPPLQKLQHHQNNMQFSAGGQSFCNGSAAALTDFRPSFFPANPSQFVPSTFNEKANLPNLTAKAGNDEVQGTAAKKTGSDQPAFKRPRIETPSPLPTFKVRKEKLGDRITALQQLVSPFGKTDTASVLHEAIEYIKFLHDQVNMLSTPYKKSGSPIHRQQISDKARDQEGSKEDLKSRGLCLVPISSTFPVASETTTDFWTPTFGSTFR